MARKKLPEPKQKQLRELYQFNYFGEIQDVSVWVYINYQKKQISLVENQPSHWDQEKALKGKPYIFQKREIEYMTGWKDILDGMKAAVVDAESKLKAFIEQEELEEAELMKQISEES